MTETPAARSRTPARRRLPRGIRRALSRGDRRAGAAGRWCTSRATTRGMAAMRASLRFFAPELPVLAFPAWDCLPYDRISPNGEIAARRMATLAALADGFDRPAAVLTTVNAATQRVPARAVLARGELHRRGRRARRRRGAARLPGADGLRPGADGDRGRRVRDPRRPRRPLAAGGARRRCGSTCSATCSRAARRFDPETQRTTEAVKRVELAPVSRGDPRRRRDPALPHPLPRDVRRGRARRPALRGGQRRAQAPGLRALAAVLPRAAGDAVRLSAGRAGAARRPGRRRRGRRAGRRSLEQYEARAAALAAKSKLGTVYKPVPPDELYLDDAAWEAAVAGRPLHQLARAAAAARARGDRRRRADRARLRARSGSRSR